jgi:hypothetical protein
MEGPWRLSRSSRSRELRGTFEGEPGNEMSQDLSNQSTDPCGEIVSTRQKMALCEFSYSKDSLNLRYNGAVAKIFVRWEWATSRHPPERGEPEGGNTNGGAIIAPRY